VEQALVTAMANKTTPNNTVGIDVDDRPLSSIIADSFEGWSIHSSSSGHVTSEQGWKKK
jgi:hypothetical protein